MARLTDLSTRSREGDIQHMLRVEGYQHSSHAGGIRAAPHHVSRETSIDVRSPTHAHHARRRYLVFHVKHPNRYAIRRSPSDGRLATVAERSVGIRTRSAQLVDSRVSRETSRPLGRHRAVPPRVMARDRGRPPPATLHAARIDPHGPASRRPPSSNRCPEHRRQPSNRHLDQPSRKPPIPDDRQTR
jgi:hypothetical protein